MCNCKNCQHHHSSENNYTAPFGNFRDQKTFLAQTGRAAFVLIGIIFIIVLLAFKTRISIKYKIPLILFSIAVIYYNGNNYLKTVH